MQCTIRERVQRQWINRKRKDMFRDLSHCSTSPPSHRRISTNSSTQDFPHREPPLRIWVIQTGSTQLLSPINTTSTQEARHNPNHLYTQRDTKQPNSTSTITSTQERYQQIQERLQLLVVSTTTNQFSHQNNILIDRIDRQLKCKKNKVFGNQITKKKTWENNQNKIKMKI